MCVCVSVYAQQCLFFPSVQPRDPCGETLSVLCLLEQRVTYRVTSSCEHLRHHLPAVAKALPNPPQNGPTRRDQSRLLLLLLHFVDSVMEGV